MKTAWLAVFALLAFPFHIYAQTDRWIVKAGENINTALPADVKFHYPQFTQGTVFFRDGTGSNALLNYNLLNGEMQFITPKTDTLTVTNEATIKHIIIGSDTFFYSKIFVQLVTGNNTVKLAKNEALGVVSASKMSGYDQESSTGSITTISSLNSNDRITKLTEKKALTVMKKTTYYFGDTYNNFLPAGKKNLINLFGKKQTALVPYLKSHKVDYSKEEDMRALLAFLQSN